MNERSDCGRRGSRRGLRLGGGRHREDLRPRRAVRAGRLRRGARRRLDPRHHLHAQGRRRAALAHPRRARRPRPGRSRPRARRRLDLDDPRLLRAAPARASVRSRDRPRLPRARRRARRRAPRRGVRQGARGLLRRGRGGAARAFSPSTGATASARCSPASTRRCAPPGAPSPSSWGSRPTSATGWTRSARPREACSPTRAPRRARRPSARAALDLPSLPETLIDLAALRARGPRAAGFEEARKAVEQAALEHAATRDRDLLQELLDLFAAEYRAAKERESALDFEDLQLLARDLLAGDERVRETEQLRFRAIMVDEFQDTNALQCDLVDLLAGGAPRRRCSTSATSSSRSTRSGTPTSASSASGGRAAAQRLTLTENYRSRPEVLAAVNHVFGEEFGDGYQPLAASGEFPDPVFGHPGRAARDRQGVVRGLRPALAARRGAERRAPRARARGHGRRDAGRDRPAVRRRHGRRVVRGGAARARASDLPRDRAAVLRPAAGGRPAHVPAAAAKPLRRRGARGGAGLADGRRLERRARADPPQRRAAAALHRDRALAAGAALGRGRAARPGVQAALRAARGRLGAGVARAPVRAGDLRARLRPRRARPLGRAAPVREPAQADAARAHLRGGARPRPRGLPRLPPRPGGARSRAARGGVRGGRSRRGAAAHDPCRQGARVQGGRRRGRRTRPRRRRHGGRDRRARRRPARLQGRPSGLGRAEGRCSGTRRSPAPAARPRAPSGCGCTTSR